MPTNTYYKIDNSTQRTYFGFFEGSDNIVTDENADRFDSRVTEDPEEDIKNVATEINQGEYNAFLGRIGTHPPRPPGS